MEGNDPQADLQAFESNLRRILPESSREIALGKAAALMSDLCPNASDPPLIGVSSKDTGVGKDAGLHSTPSVWIRSGSLWDRNCKKQIQGRGRGQRTALCDQIPVSALRYIAADPLFTFGGTNLKDSCARIFPNCQHNLEVPV